MATKNESKPAAEKVNNESNHQPQFPIRYTPPAIFASIYVLNILCDLRLYGRYINNLMTQRFFAGFFKICAAASAYFWFEMKMFFYQLLRQKLSQVRFMTFSCSTFFTPTLRQYDGHSGRIRRWRFGGIPGVHPQKPFKLFDTLFQLNNFVFQLLYICVFVHKTVIGQRQRFAKVYLYSPKVGERLQPTNPAHR
jgi:hypothetical protein